MEHRPVEWDPHVAPGWGLDGNKLHQEVCMKRWCITRHDLRFLQKCIKVAVAKGVIKPTDRDMFDPKDDCFGPNMYTVAKQYITPLTGRAGNMSFALLCHPEGLPCELFISHCWQEGAYEFIKKVLHSWPHRMHNAYCCVFSNPQNLDISRLIACPRESPFAKCLASASHVLVVPNRVSSVYTRLWCVYEVYLACSQDKIILTAVAPRLKVVVWHLPIMFAVWALGSVVAFARYRMDGIHGIVTFCLLAALAKLSHCEGPLRSRQWAPRLPLVCLMNLAGSAVGGAIAGSYALVIYNIQRDGLDHVYVLWRFVDGIFWMLGASVYFFLSEADRLSLLTDRLGDEELGKGFTHISNARCSRQQDTMAINEEIKEFMLEVNDTVRVLLSAGMSTPHLRKAWKRNANILHAGRWRYVDAFVVVFGMLHPLSGAVVFGLEKHCLDSYEDQHCKKWVAENWCAESNGHTFEKIYETCPVSCGTCVHETVHTVWAATFTVVMIAHLSLAVFFSARRRDRLAFAISSTYRMMLLSAFTMQAVNLSVSGMLGYWKVTLKYHVPCFTIFLALSFIFASLGVAGTSRIPFIGPLITSVLGPSVHFHCAGCARATRTSASSLNEAATIGHLHHSTSDHVIRGAILASVSASDDVKLASPEVSPGQGSTMPLAMTMHDVVQDSLLTSASTSDACVNLQMHECSL